MREDRPLGPVEELRREKLEKLKKCFSELNGYAVNKLRLQYPTFFIPGWTGEDCAAWLTPYKDLLKKYQQYYQPVSHWIDEIIENPENAHYVTFSSDETCNSESFVELGSYLKKKIISATPEQYVNLVGHSMGGLDIRAAMIDDDILRVKNIITVGTPNNGSPEAGLLKYPLVRNIMNGIKPLAPHHFKQCYNIRPDSQQMKLINSKENRLNLLNRVERFYIFMGLRDSTVRRSPILNNEGLPDEIYSNKVKVIQTSSAEHTGKDGVTQDPRILLPIIKTLCGIKLTDDYNHGYIYVAPAFYPPKNKKYLKNNFRRDP